MPPVGESSSCNDRPRHPLFVPVLALVVIGILWPAATAVAAAPSVPSGFAITKIAAPRPGGASNCDDLGFLDGHLFMGCQNKTLSVGGGGDSTLIEYTPTGAVVNTWSIQDKIDGLAGDPLTHQVILTLNEDANSHLLTITPSAPAGRQMTRYAYSPDPRAGSTPAALHTGGGTDQVSVDSVGHILITASHAGLKTGTAVFDVHLTAPSSPSATGTATLRPTFQDDATATNGNSGSGTVKLGLGDVDSGAIVPASIPRFGGGYVVTDQTALQLVFATNVFKGTGVTALKTAFGLDDLLWTTSRGGTLYVVDKGKTAALPAVSSSALYRVTGPFAKNTLLASNDGVGDQVVTVNMANGGVTPFVQHLNTTKGLVYVDASGSAPRLGLNGGAGEPVAPAALVGKSSKGSSNTGLIVAIIVVVLALLGAAGYSMARRARPAR